MTESKTELRSERQPDVALWVLDNRQKRESVERREKVADNALCVEP